MQPKTFRPSKKLMGKKLGDEWMFLHLENGQYYGLNETGSWLWDRLTSQKDLKAVLEDLHQLYGVDRETLEKDLRHFLRELEKEGLAEIANSAA